MDVVSDDLFSAGAVVNPYPVFAHLRVTDPVHWVERDRAWLVTRHDDVIAGLHDPRFSSNRVVTMSEQAANPMQGPTNLLSDWMVFKDPPDHTRLRRLVQKAFSPGVVRTLEPTVQLLVEEQLDRLADAEPPGGYGHGVVDVQQTFASVLPAVVVAHMLGVPESDRLQFKTWSEELAPMVFFAPGVADRRERGARALGELGAYFGELMHARRVAPTDDLMTALVEVHDEGMSLTTDELLATCTLLLFAGHETTTALITNGLAALLEAPDQRDLLMADPTLIGSAVEELLRFDGPAKVELRRAVEPVELRGRMIEPGERMFFATAAANRDPEVFTQPDHLDITRTLNQHVGFGFGIHFCLGASLARLEAAIALRSMFERFPDMQLVTSPSLLPWSPVLASRSLLSLPVYLRPDLG